VTDRWGIDDRYEDASGLEHRIAPATVDRLREVIGDPGGGAGNAALVLRPGDVVENKNKRNKEK